MQGALQLRGGGCGASKPPEDFDGGLLQAPIKPLTPRVSVAGSSGTNSRPSSRNTPRKDFSKVPTKPKAAVSKWKGASKAVEAVISLQKLEAEKKLAYSQANVLDFFKPFDEPLAVALAEGLIRLLDASNLRAGALVEFDRRQELEEREDAKARSTRELGTHAACESSMNY